LQIPLFEKQEQKMKRKRGPAPREKGRRVKRKDENDAGSISEENSDSVNRGEDSFEGFSTDEDEFYQPAIATTQNKVLGQNGDSGVHRKRGKKPAPTQEELLDLYYRSSSFQSNLFKLQVDELLSEVRVKYDKMEKVEKILRQLRETLLQLPSGQEQLVPLPASKLTASYITLTQVSKMNIISVCRSHHPHRQETLFTSSSSRSRSR
jgi:hypothetical protein